MLTRTKPQKKKNWYKQEYGKKKEREKKKEAVRIEGALWNAGQNKNTNNNS